MPQFASSIIESIAPAKACLVGSVMTIRPPGLPLSQLTLPQFLASRSLKLVHRRGLVSSQLMSAMLKKTILPRVEINTPNGVVTLTNAQIVKGVPLPKHGTGRRNDTDELEEFDLVFGKLTCTWQGGKGGQDDWTPVH